VRRWASAQSRLSFEDRDPRIALQTEAMAEAYRGSSSTATSDHELAGGSGAPNRARYASRSTPIARA